MVALNVPTLYESVVALSSRCGFACIPLQSDSKRPPSGFDLSRCFKQPPTSTELQAWFTADTTNFAVLCGSVSNNLFVIDFDTAEAYRIFCRAFPSLAQSYTVQTRRGYHVYLRAPHSRLHTRKLRGADLKAKNGYVVGAGSIINGVTYTVAVDAPVMLVDDSTINSIIVRLSDTPRPTTSSQRISQHTTALKLVQHYKTQALVVGRNNALYAAALNAAYAGMTTQSCIDTLASLHAHTAPASQHTPETPQQRLIEAHSTILSAYKAASQITCKNIYAPEKTSTTNNDHHSPSKNNEIRFAETISIGIPNVIRECLIQNHQTTTARMLDAFHLSGWQSGKTFTLKEALSCTRLFTIGRASVIKSLRIAIGLEKLFTPARDMDNSIPNSNHKQSPTKPGRGKPTTRLYIMPDHTQLAAALGVELGGSTDKLNPDDLRSNKAYRMALHREFVRRQAPELSSRFMAERLGINERSLRRYNAALHLIRTPIYGYEVLAWSNVDHAALWGETRINKEGGAVVAGRWLQSRNGKRYPALKGVALRLLVKGETTLYCRRLPSRLQLRSDEHRGYVGANLCVRPTSCNSPQLPSDSVGVVGVLGEGEIIWRHLSARNPDWCGAERAFPPLDVLLFEPTTSHIEPSDDLTVIKGIGRSWARILRKNGIDSFTTLAHLEDVGRVAKLFFSPYLTSKQVSYWVYQAQMLERRAVTPDGLKTWRYADWRAFQFERARLNPNISPRLKWKIAEEFIDFEWFKYKPELPDWFTDLVEKVRDSRLF